MINSNDLADYFLVLLNKRFAYTACFTVVLARDLPGPGTS